MGRTPWSAAGPPTGLRPEADGGAGQRHRHYQAASLVVSAEKFNYWRDTPGNVYFEAATEGEVLYEGA